MKEALRFGEIRSLIPATAAAVVKRMVVNVAEKVGTMIPAGKVREASRKQTASEASKAD